jgi:hypothetical protein
MSSQRFAQRSAPSCILAAEKIEVLLLEPELKHR